LGRILPPLFYLTTIIQLGNNLTGFSAVSI
jgi:hypothetical protein